MLHIQRDVKDLLAIFETVSKDNGKQANISAQLDKLQNILSNMTLSNKDAKSILDDIKEVTDVPAAVGFYWICSTVFGFVQTLIMNKFYSPDILNAKAEAAHIARLELDEKNY